MSTKPKTETSKEPPKVVKGMRDLVGEQLFAFQGFFEKAAEIALYYGFKPIETPMLEHEELFVRGVGEATDAVGKEMYTLRTKGGDKLALRPEGTAPVMRAYIEQGMQSLPQPIMLYYHGPLFRHENPQKGRYRQYYTFGVEVLGTTKSIADAMVIKLFTVILAEAGITNTELHINSIGDKECRHIYRRELINYYKKHSKNICPDCRERLKTNPLRVLDCKNPKCQPIKKSAPESVSYLCSACKSHFKEVLEYLETMGIPYTINPGLVRGLDYYSRTVFEILELPTEKTNTDVVEPNQDPKTEIEPEPIGAPLAIAGGGRYDYLARMIGSKKDVPATGAGIGVDRVIMSSSYANLAPRIVKKPKIFFIQLSFDAKLKSFEVIEILREARIPVAHSLSKDSLGAQLAIAEKSKAPYTIILGQKEAIDGTVIVRNMNNRSQDTVKIKDLGPYLKKVFAK